MVHPYTHSNQIAYFGAPIWSQVNYMLDHAYLFIRYGATHGWGIFTGQTIFVESRDQFVNVTQISNSTKNF